MSNPRDKVYLRRSLRGDFPLLLYTESRPAPAMSSKTRILITGATGMDRREATLNGMLLTLVYGQAT